MSCPNCGYDLVKKNGKDRKGGQRFYCDNCGRTFGEGRVLRAGLENKVTSLESRLGVYERRLRSVEQDLLAVDLQIAKLLAGYVPVSGPDEIPF